jgi:hypothetical protein
MQLNLSRRSVRSKKRTEDAGWRTNRVDDAAERGGCNVCIRLVKVRMIEDVEELGPFSSAAQFVKIVSIGRSNPNKLERH